MRVLRVLFLGDLTKEKFKKGKGKGKEKGGMFPLIFCFFALREVKNCCEENKKDGKCLCEFICRSYWDDFCGKKMTDEEIISFLQGFKPIWKKARGLE